jgi:hypothetical protein
VYRSNSRNGANLKNRIELTRLILMVAILLNGFLVNSIYCQEIKQDTSKIEIFELDKGCKLIFEKNIDLTDSASTEIVEGIRNIIPTIQKLIPADSVTIILKTQSEYLLPVWGIGSGTFGDDSGERVEIYFDPNHPNFRIEYIFRTLVHEMHHVGRIRNPDYDLTLLECMVNEGLADHFMVEVLNCEITPWASALTEEQIQENIIRVKPFLRIKNEWWTTEFSEKYFDPWMFGRGGEEPIPHWTGYSIGWKIVEDYLNVHPDATASSLVWTHAEIIASSTPELYVENDDE